MNFQTRLEVALTVNSADVLRDIEVAPDTLTFGEQLGEGQFGVVVKATTRTLPGRVLFRSVG